MTNPIQIILNPRDYDEARETAGGGRPRDFFANRDAEFAAHKAALIAQLDAIAQVIQSQPQGAIGYVKVILRREALAKSHRPTTALFRPDRTPMVGGGDLGVLIIEASPESLLAPAAARARAGGREPPRARHVRAPAPHPGRAAPDRDAVRPRLWISME